MLFHSFFAHLLMESEQSKKDMERAYTIYVRVTYIFVMVL